MDVLLLDTDTLSEILKGKNQAVVQRTLKYWESFPKLQFTSLSVYEILLGLRKRDAWGQQGRAESLFATNIEIVPEPSDYRLAADIAGDLLKIGRPIGTVDPVIAACAIRRGCGVATGNMAHFLAIRQAGYELPLENWREI